MTEIILSTEYTSGILNAIPDDKLMNILISDIQNDIQNKLNEIAKSAHTLKLDFIKILKRAVKLKDKTIREA